MFFCLIKYPRSHACGRFSPSARRDRGTVASKRELSVLAQAQQSESNLIVDSGEVGGG